jgi:hypothetical protein
MTYQSIICGARGLLYFGGAIPAASTPEDAKLGWNWTFWRNVLRPVIEEIGDKRPLYRALLAPNSKLRISIEGNNLKPHELEFIARETDDALFILAAKREGATVNVKFTGLPAGATTADVLYESPRKVEAKNSAFTDWFAPFDVHIYRFPRPNPR